MPIKLGGAQILPELQPGAPHAITPEIAAKIRGLGLLGVSVFLSKPLETSLKDVLHVKQTLVSAGLEVAQANGWYECLVNPDDALLRSGIRGLEALTRMGRELNARCVYVRPGSLNPRGHWWPHPGNHSLEIFNRLVKSLRTACATAAQEGMDLAVEGHVLSPLDSPEAVRNLLDAVASPHLKFNLDPVNFMGTVADVHDTRPKLNQLFDLLGEEGIIAHAKDCALRDALVVHIEEVIPGQGSLDYDLFLHRFSTKQPNGYVLIEHLPMESIPAARNFILQVANTNHIDLLDGI
jgi:sugar phosphate isomerase/epimerase